MHAWFRNIDWEKLVAKKITPPFVPECESAEDTGNIGEEFLNCSITQTPAMESELTRMHNKEGAFDNFDYISDSQQSIIEVS